MIFEERIGHLSSMMTHINEDELNKNQKKEMINFIKNFEPVIMIISTIIENYPDKKFKIKSKEYSKKLGSKITYPIISNDNNNVCILDYTTLCDDIINKDLPKGYVFENNQKHFYMTSANNRLFEAVEDISKSGYMLTGLSEINKTLIGGSITTGSHGAGKKFGTISDNIEAMIAIDKSGNLIWVKNEDLFNRRVNIFNQDNFIILFVIFKLISFQNIKSTWKISKKNSLNINDENFDSLASVTLLPFNLQLINYIELVDQPISKITNYLNQLYFQILFIEPIFKVIDWLLTIIPSLGGILRLFFQLPINSIKDNFFGNIPDFDTNTYAIECVIPGTQCNLDKVNCCFGNFSDKMDIGIRIWYRILGGNKVCKSKFGLNSGDYDFFICLELIISKNQKNTYEVINIFKLIISENFSDYKYHTGKFFEKKEFEKQKNVYLKIL